MNQMKTFIITISLSFKHFLYSLFHQYSLFWAIFSIFRTFGIFIFFLWAEYNYAKYMTLAKKISENTLTLNTTEENSIYDGQFVFLRTNNISYSKLTDNLFNISKSAAILFRQVEYCQWIEQGFESSDKMTRTRRYRKDWISKPLNSSNYMDKTYSNPQISLFSESTLYSNATVDLYTLSSEIFQYIIPDQTLFLDDEMKQSFLSSSASQSFNYIEDGWFYKGKDYDIISKIQQLENTKSIIDPLIYFFNIFGVDIQKLNLSIFPRKYKYSTRKQLLKSLFLKCEAGDIRIKFLYWAPESISAVGFVENTTIKRHNVNNVSMGSVQKGYLSKLKVLYKQHIIPRKVAYSARFLTIFSLFIFILRRSPSENARIWNYAFLGFLILAFRSIIWQSTLLNPYIWCPIFLIFSYVYSGQPGEYIYF